MNAVTDAISPGYYRDLSNEAYHKGPGVSKSQLDLIHKSPALFQWNQAAPEDEEKKAALNIGDAVHAILLEPHRFGDEYVIAPECDRRTKVGKQQYEEFEASITNQTVLTADEGRKVHLIRESVMAHPHARWLIEAEGDAEASIYWKERSTGLLARCRPDKTIPSLGWIADVKTTADMDRFARSVYEYRYHVQDPFYCDGYEAQFGEQPAAFVFLVVSTSIECGKYPVRLFTLDHEAKQIGRDTYLEDMATYADCIRTGEWSGLETLSLPYWAKDRR